MTDAELDRAVHKTAGLEELAICKYCGYEFTHVSEDYGYCANCWEEMDQDRE